MSTAVDHLVDEARQRQEDLVRRASIDLPPVTIRRRLRIGVGLTYEDIADAFGVTSTTICRWELGHRTPRGEHLERYAELLQRLGELQ